MFRILLNKLTQYDVRHIYTRGFQLIMTVSTVSAVSVQTYDVMCMATDQHKYIICKDKPAIVTIPLYTFIFALGWPFVVIGVPIGGTMYMARRSVSNIKNTKL